MDDMQRQIKPVKYWAQRIWTIVTLIAPCIALWYVSVIVTQFLPTTPAIRGLMASVLAMIFGLVWGVLWTLRILPRLATVQRGIAPIGQRSSGQVDIVGLRQILAKHFDEGELSTLCFDLNIDYESLPGQGRTGKARDLVAYVIRHGRIDELVTRCYVLRPHADWQNVAQNIKTR